MSPHLNLQIFPIFVVCALAFVYCIRKFPPNLNILIKKKKKKKEKKIVIM